MIQYHVVLDGKVCGPYTLDDLRSLPLKRDTLIWCQGMEKWDNAEKIESLKNLFQNIPPPIPTQPSNSSNVIISSPVDVNIRKVKKSKVKKNKTGKKASNIIASEIVVNLKLMGIAIIITLIFLLGFYVIKNPPTNAATYAHYQQVEEDFEKRIEKYTDSPPTDLKRDYSLLYTNHSKYDRWCYNRDDFSSALAFNYHINKCRKSYFYEEMKENGILCIVISLIGLIVGRYFILIGKWIYKNSKA